jgi:hypothetical protein
MHELMKIAEGQIVTKNDWASSISTPANSPSKKASLQRSPSDRTEQRAHTHRTEVKSRDKMSKRSLSSHSPEIEGNVCIN